MKYTAKITFKDKLLLIEANNEAEAINKVNLLLDSKNDYPMTDLISAGVR